MAGAFATSNGVSEKRSEESGDKTGWLSKKTHLTRRWTPVWVHIKGSRLYYGKSEKTSVKFISLIGAEVEALENNKSFGWTIKPKNRNRTFFLKAGSAEEQQQWMEALVQAQISTTEHPGNACVLQ